MIEYPEALTLARQLSQTCGGKTVARVFPPTKPHKFCWFCGSPAEYEARLRGCQLLGAEGFGIFVELCFSGGWRLCFNDGVSPRFLPADAVPGDYQLLIQFTDGQALAFTVAMYGGLYLHDGSFDNEYYQRSRQALPPSSPEFAAYYATALAQCKPSLSVKGFLATQQRFPGLGNGVLQDILLQAGIHPKRKLSALSESERQRLLACVVSVLESMAAQGGRDTEKDLFGQPGGYTTWLSRSALKSGCPVCNGPITKEAYLGGAVYFCPHCQPQNP